MFDDVVLGLLNLVSQSIKHFGMIAAFSRAEGFGYLINVLQCRIILNVSNVLSFLSYNSHVWILHLIR